MLSWIVILSLANWRIVSLLHMESMFDWLRKWMKIEQTIENDPHTWVYPDNLVGNLFSCFWCLSLWTSWIVTIIASIILRPTVVEWIWMWLSIATGTIIIEKWIGRSKARW
jgi:hypothetical protein